ncbi:MAG: response regulator transcription factor FixJ [Hyphomicrobiales bacterium]|nr:response regulator transcription factor FixJ [Hyphomicrobiales bacterium]
MSTTSLVHVIDDDEAVRDSLAFLLRSAKMDVRTYDSATAFLKALSAGLAGCVITDVRMPGMSGVDLLRHLKANGSSMPVIVITGHGDIQLAVQAMKLGAVDFLEKPFDDEALLESVHAALGRLAKDAQRESERADLGSRIAALSSREREVLEGLVAGKSNKIIAFDLGISPRTVEIYRAHVMTKMNAGSLSELVRMALIAGVHPPDQS